MPFVNREKKLSYLLTACRRAEDSRTRVRLHTMLKPYLMGEASQVWRTQQIGWERYYGSFGQLDERPELTTSLVLKAPGPDGEKGVLYSAFEYNWMRLIAHHDARSILSEYLLVGASSWSPTDYAALANFAGLSDDPVFIGISNNADLEAYKVMSPVIEPLPVLASDLVNPSYYVTKPTGDREIDILMVANWKRFKRHWLLFEALSRMPKNLRVVLVGRNAPGRTEREIRAEARAFGAPQDIEYLTNISIDEVIELECNARVSAIFSYREGSCVAAAESLFANTPVAMMEDAHVGSKAYINSCTGVLLSRENLSRSLSRFLEESEGYSPRAWAMGRIDCNTTSNRLNRILREYSLKAGLPWTEDIAPFCRRYVPAYVNEADKIRLRPAVEELKARHGIELQEFTYSPT